jgi:TPR repeat protein
MRTLCAIMMLILFCTTGWAQTDVSKPWIADVDQLFRQAKEQKTYGEGEKLIIEALKRLQLEADKGDPEAQMSLAMKALSEQLPPGFDNIDVLGLLLKAAKQGHQGALLIYCATVLSSGGKADPQNIAFAVKALKELADQGSADAKSLLAPMYFVSGDREGFEKEFARMRAQADSGDAEQQYLVAMIYFDPYLVGFPFDEAKGLRYMEQAAEGGSTDAQNFLGQKYIYGQNVDRNQDLALKYFKMAALSAKPDPSVYETTVGKIYLEMAQSEADYAQAFEWLSKASARGNRLAQYYLANMYSEGKGVAKDEAKAEELFKESSRP